MALPALRSYVCIDTLKRVPVGVPSLRGGEGRKLSVSHSGGLRGLKDSCPAVGKPRGRLRLLQGSLIFTESGDDSVVIFWSLISLGRH